jgi:hypothetical protein
MGLLVMVSAVYATTSIVCTKWLELWGPLFTSGVRVKQWLYRLLTCHLCFGQWASFAVVAAWGETTGFAEFGVTSLAVNGLHVAAHSVINSLGRR